MNQHSQHKSLKGNFFFNKMVVGERFERSKGKP